MATSNVNGEAAAAVDAPTPMQRYSDAVAQNPLDFDSWVQLLALVESDASVPRATVEATFDQFLTEFPLCFGYWNKYAQYELGLATKAASTDGTSEPTAEPVDPADAMKNARAVYERGVAAVRFSVQMWQKYLEFLIDTARVPLDDARAALEDAVAACANDPLAGPLWEMYIQLETIHNDMLRLNQVFKRVLAQPLSNLDEFWERYNQFVLAQQLHVLATPAELQAMGAEEEMDEGLLRVKIVNSVESIKNKTLEGITKRQAFEAGIDRNYFHVTPVSDAAIKNWHAYLDYEEIAGDDTRCELLYERCLISCANYETMWVRYALWKERTQGFDAANDVYQRAVNVFLKYRATIYLEYATFLEAHRKIQIARDTYAKVLRDVAPQLVEAYVRVANFERRQGQLETAKSWYEMGLEVLGDKKKQEDAFAFLAVSYATFAQRIMKNTALARSVYERATQKVTSSLVLWLQFIQFETSLDDNAGDRVVRVGGVFASAVAEITALSNDEKNDLWLQYADFMETYSSDIADVRAVHEKEVTWRRKNGVARDRTAKVLVLESAASEEEYSNSVEVGMKRARIDSGPATAAVAANGTATDAATAAAYAQYYQQYQGYAGYGQAADATTQAAATTAAADPAAYAQYAQQYAAYYQQQQQQQTQQ